MFIKGQTVYLEKLKRNPGDRTGAITEGVVSVAGSKYYTVTAGYHKLKFEKDTLLEVVDMGGPMFNLFPSEQAVYDDRERCRLHDAVRTVVERNNCYISLDKLRRIHAILEEEDKFDGQQMDD